MNVLILTPDRVGSTLLQRLITVYMQMHEFDRPVINLHELTNGLIKYYSPVFNQEVLGKPNERPWGYYQSLNEITELLHSVDHYKTSRLAQYHLKNRADSIRDQVPFYQYLNDNFFIISARRENLLEHALSWGIQTHSKKLNVYSHQEKLSTFADIYQNRITIEPETITLYLDRYVDYLKWVDDHFTVNSYFEYEKHLPNIEQYILGLDIFGDQPKSNWADRFKIEFQDWNRCHYLASDLSGFSAQLSAPDQLRLGWNAPNRLELQPVTSQRGIVSGLSTQDQQFVKQHFNQYITVHQAIDQLVENKILVTGIPIKLQTMMEKSRVIRNFDQCVQVYNQWVEKNKIGTVYSDSQIDQNVFDEIARWHAVPKLS